MHQSFRLSAYIPVNTVNRLEENIFSTNFIIDIQMRFSTHTKTKQDE